MDKMKKMLEIVAMAKASNRDLHMSLDFNFYDNGDFGFRVTVIRFLGKNFSRHVSRIFSSYKIEEVTLVDFKAGMDKAINEVKEEAKKC